MGNLALRDAVVKHMAHDIRECDCAAAIIVLALSVREMAEWVSANAETLDRLGRMLSTPTTTDQPDPEEKR